MKKRRFAKVRKFIEEHKKPILIIGGALVTGALAVIGGKVLEQGEPKRYSSLWFDHLSDDELGPEREKVRLAYQSSGDDFDSACEMEALLRRFDSEIWSRKDDGMDDYVFPPRREHGRNLYKPD